MKYFFKRRMAQEDKEAAAIEFSILLPVMLLLLVGLYDVSNFVFCNNKMNRTAQGISNIVSRGDVTKPELDNMLKAAQYVAQPFNFIQSGNVIVTSIAHPDPNPQKPAQVMWRDSYPGGTAGSRVSAGSLPGGLVLSPNDTVIFTEVFFDFEPLFPIYNITLSARTKIYAIAAAVPRQGTMTTLAPN